LKILIYTEYFFPIPGGVQTIVFELARGLSEWSDDNSTDERFDITIVTRTSSPSNAAGELGPFRVIRRPGWWQLVKVVRAADVVHLAGPALLPMIISVVLGKPFVVEHHGFHAACPNGLMFFEPEQGPCSGHFMAKRYAKCLECNREVVGLARSLYWLVMTPLRRWLTNRARRNIMPTNWLGDMLKLNSSTTIHHGISVPSEPVTGDKGSNAVFAFQGRMVTTKGAALLLDATRLVQRNHSAGVEVKFIGDGPELVTLKAKSTDLGGHVEFMGHVDDTSLERALSKAATVVMPSLGGEVFGLVAAENMMRGKLLIVSDIGALKEVVGNTGLVFPAADVEALASLMNRTLVNAELAKSLGAAARERAVRMFNRDNMVRAHVSCYLEALRH
jgi:glycosyltransferase involved in cell wall biosynthesis